MSALDRSREAAVRSAAFEWLRAREREHGVSLPWSILIQGFEYRSTRVPLVSMQGIFKPKILDVPISIRTSAKGPYEDGIADDRLFYRYRGRDPSHRDNRGLQTAMMEDLPLVYFHAVASGRYLATYPVRIVADRPHDLTFTVSLDEAATDYAIPHGGMTGREGLLRGYQTAQVRRRVHQGAFRERVLAAYRERCALCRLKHRELLDAAHIIPDAEPEGVAEVRNGLSLCRLHHSAFDSLFIGITPDYRVEVRPDLLEEEDGPTLKHAIQGIHGSDLLLPRAKVDRPDRGLLEVRFQRFIEAAR
ncbi:MAG: HNH endonuclease [Longimicrobiales bacterium]